MPIVPGTPGLPSATGEGTSPVLDKPSDSNLLMAAADMHTQGKLQPQAPKLPRTATPRSVSKRRGPRG